MSVSPKTVLSTAKELYHGNRVKDCYRLLSQNEAPDELLQSDQAKDFYLYKAMCETDMGIWALAEQSMLKSLHVCKSIGVYRLIYNRIDNLATIYTSSRQYEKAITSLNESLKLKHIDNNEPAMSLGYLQLAQIFFTIESYEAAADALEKAGHNIRKHKQEEHFKYWYFIYARQLRREGKLKEAAQAYTKALSYAVKFTDSDSILRSYANRGGIYLELKNWTKAEKDIREAILLSKASNQHADLASYYISLATVLLETNRFAECAKILKEITQGKVNTNRSSNVLRDAAEVQARLYKAQGHTAKALEHYEEYIKHYRETYDADLNGSLLNLQAKYESEKKERELQQAQLQRVESELRALRAQMNPHFVFNALSSIRKQMLKGDTDTADDYIVRFSRLLRLILDSTRTPLVKLSDNITMLDLYMQIEQARQNNSFKYSIKTTATLRTDELYVPGMILQPLIENAIIHGLFPKQGNKGLLTIAFSKTGNTLKVTVTDNGVGRTKAGKDTSPNHQSHALNIVKETLDLAWGNNTKKGYLQVTDKKDSKGKAAGTSVQVLLPLHLKP